MQQEVIISGFGGQGTLFAGQLLAHAVMESGLHVTWIPSYGPEMRGGMARCTVVMSDQEIGAPLVRRPTSALVFNIPSFEGFEPMVKPDGLLLVNSSLIPHRSERSDIRKLYIPATDLATDMGNARLANVICLGAFVQATGVVTVDAVKTALEHNLPARHRKLLHLNYEAIDKGAALAQDMM